MTDVTATATEIAKAFGVDGGEEVTVLRSENGNAVIAVGSNEYLITTQSSNYPSYVRDHQLRLNNLDGPVARPIKTVSGQWGHVIQGEVLELGRGTAYIEHHVPTSRLTKAGQGRLEFLREVGASIAELHMLSFGTIAPTIQPRPPHRIDPEKFAALAADSPKTAGRIDAARPFMDEVQAAVDKLSQTPAYGSCFIDPTTIVRDAESGRLFFLELSELEERTVQADMWVAEQAFNTRFSTALDGDGFTFFGSKGMAGIEALHDGYLAKVAETGRDQAPFRYGFHVQRLDAIEEAVNSELWRSDMRSMQMFVRNLESSMAMVERGLGQQATPEAAPAFP